MGLLGMVPSSACGENKNNHVEQKSRAVEVCTVLVCWIYRSEHFICRCCHVSWCLSVICTVCHNMLYTTVIRRYESTPCFRKKLDPFVISSYLCFDSYKLHENFQKYTEDVACCEYGINVCDSLAVLLLITL